jgi:hypothetical protein
MRPACDGAIDLEIQNAEWRNQIVHIIFVPIILWTVQVRCTRRQRRSDTPLAVESNTVARR